MKEEKCVAYRSELVFCWYTLIRFTITSSFERGVGFLQRVNYYFNGKLPTRNSQLLIVLLPQPEY